MGAVSYQSLNILKAKLPIQKAVIDLVLEGIDKGIWQVADTNELSSSEVFKAYKKEKSGQIESIKNKVAEKNMAN